MINCKTYDLEHLRHLRHTADLQMSEYRDVPSNQAISTKRDSNLSIYRLHIEAVYIRTITPR